MTYEFLRGVQFREPLIGCCAERCNVSTELCACARAEAVCVIPGSVHVYTCVCVLDIALSSKLSSLHRQAE